MIPEPQIPLAPVIRTSGRQRSPHQHPDRRTNDKIGEDARSLHRGDDANVKCTSKDSSVAKEYNTWTVAGQMWKDAAQRNVGPISRLAVALDDSGRGLLLLV